MASELTKQNDELEVLSREIDAAERAQVRSISEGQARVQEAWSALEDRHDDMYTQAGIWRAQELVQEARDAFDRAHHADHLLPAVERHIVAAGHLSTAAAAAGRAKGLLALKSGEQHVHDQARDLLASARAALKEGASAARSGGGGERESATGLELAVAKVQGICAEVEGMLGVQQLDARESEARQSASAPVEASPRGEASRADLLLQGRHLLQVLRSLDTRSEAASEAQVALVGQRVSDLQAQLAHLGLADKGLTTAPEADSSGGRLQTPSSALASDALGKPGRASPRQLPDAPNMSLASRSPNHRGRSAPGSPRTHTEAHPQRDDVGAAVRGAAQAATFTAAAPEHKDRGLEAAPFEALGAGWEVAR